MVASTSQPQPLADPIHYEQTILQFLDSPEVVKVATNTTRLINKLKLSVQNKQFYEAHQILRTIHFRYVSTKERVFVLKDLLYIGSSLLLGHMEHVSGQDIATLFLEACAKCLAYTHEENTENIAIRLSIANINHHSENKTLEWEICDRVAQIAILLPPTELGRNRYIAEILKHLTPNLVNRDLLRNVLALRFWKAKDYANSRYHFMYCASIENAKDIGNLLVDYQTDSASKGEIDLFVTQFIFQFLCLQSPSDNADGGTSNNSRKSRTQHASTDGTEKNITLKTRSMIKSISDCIFTTYCEKHPELGTLEFSNMPLLNFVQFIISSLDGGQESESFQLLCDLYKQSWERDPNYESYLKRIGSLYFGIMEQTQRPGGLFGNIMQLLLDPDDEDDDANSGSSARQQQPQQGAPTSRPGPSAGIAQEDVD